MRLRTGSELEAILDASPIAIALMSNDQTVQRCNRAFEQILGWQAEEIRGRAIPVPESRQSEWERCVEGLRLGRSFMNLETVRIRKDGSEFNASISGAPLRDEAGAITGHVATIVDITERKRSEEALRESEEKWKAVFENNPTMYFMVDAGGTILSVNPFGAEQLGYTVGELIGRPVLNVFYAADREAVQANVGLCLEQLGRTMSWEFRKVRKDGSILWVRETAKAVLMRDRRIVLIACEDVTDGKRAEEALTRSEKELRDVIETIPAMAWTTLPDGTNTFANKRWAEYSGLSAEDTARSEWQTTIHPEDLERYLVNWRNSLETGEPLEDEVRFRRAADGEYRWFLVRSVPLRDQQGNILKWYGILTDIEDRKRAEERLRLSEAYLTEAQRLTHTGSFSWDVKTNKALHLSEEWYRIYGLDPDTDGQAWEERFGSIDPEDRSKLQSAIRRAIEEKTGYDLEYRIFRHTGETRYLHVVGHPISNSLGDVVQFMGSVTDITERKRAEEELRAAETRFRTYVDHATDALFVRDEQGKVIDVNRQACDSLGYTREELIGTLPGHIDPCMDQAFMKKVRDRLDAGEIFAFESSHRRKDGTLFPVEVRVRPFRHGGYRFALSMARDITDRKRAEEERERLRRLQADLAHINRVTTMGELTASLAHEINQPIAAAVTNADTCVRWLSETPDIEEAREAAKRASKDARRAAEIINRIRAMFKKGGGQRELVDINEIINEMVVLLRNEATRYAVSIRTELTADLPQVFADRVQMQQVLMNLIINGVEAMKSVERHRELKLCSQRDGSGEVRVCVTDTGVGLPAEANHIFDAFFTTKPEGTGMGLAISRSIIEAHGGRFWASSKSGSGATFWFTLPVTPEAHR